MPEKRLTGRLEQEDTELPNHPGDLGGKEGHMGIGSRTLDTGLGFETRSLNL